MAGVSALFRVVLAKLASPEIVEFFRGQKNFGFMSLEMIIGRDVMLDERLDGAEEKQLKDRVVEEMEFEDRAAEEKQLKDRAVKGWLKELEDLFYEAEDLLDEISSKAFRRKLEAKTPSKTTRVMKLVPTSPNLRNKAIKRKFQEINKKIDFLLGLVEENLVNTRPSVIRKLIGVLPPTNSYVIESKVYGRDADKEAIIKMLLSEDEAGNNVGVIPIVGMRGIGKTTLARFVYDDNMVKKHFEHRMWVCVPCGLDISDVTKTILEGISLQPCGIMDRYTVQSRLEEIIEGKKFLLVLDDVSSVNIYGWRTLYSSLSYGANGSKIVVTTDSQEVESLMPMGSSYNLDRLSDENCWGLFASRAFGSQERMSNPELEAIGREIVESYGGLPLAAKALGALLHLNPEVEAWKAILTSPILSRFSVMDCIVSVLDLSYLNLPSHLKRCFAYCSIFPRGYEFEKEKLVLLWMAEGLLQQSNGNKRPEELGDAYFYDLLFRSFFQQSSGDKSRFTMHDLIYELAVFVSGESCIRNSKLSKISARVRHCSFITGKYEADEILQAISDAKFLKTFLPFQPLMEHVAFEISNKQLKDLLSRLRRLRVLCLSHYHITMLPDSIGSLKHLRYLDLSHTAIQKLSHSVSALCNLQTLLLSNCRFLIELPRDFAKLINLRHLDIGGTHLKEMPPEMSRLQNLQILTNFIVGKCGGSRIVELGNLLSLHGTLCISELQNVVVAREASTAYLKNNLYLDELVLQWSDSSVNKQNDIDVLGQLQPHAHLEKLSIEFYGGTRFPDWLGAPSFSKMLFLRLSNCNYCSSLPPIGRLPSLRDLIIEGIKGVQRVGFEFYGMDLSSTKPFQSLKTLKFEGMLGWEEWIFPEVESEGFPCLEELYLLRCPKLKSNIPNAVTIKIDECPELMATRQKSEVINVLQSHDGDKLQSISDDEPATQYAEHRTEISTMPDNFQSETGVPINTGYSQNSSKDISASESLKVSETSELKDFPPCLHSPKTEYMSASDGLATQGHSEDISALESLKGSDGLATQGYSEDVSASESLKVSEISQLMDLPPELRSLKIEGCDALKSLTLMHRNHDLSDLRHLHIINCCSLESFHGGQPPTTLKTLYIHNCRKLEFISPAGTMHHLEHLCIENSCDSLTSFPLASFPKLKSLSVWDCANFSSISVPSNDFRSLDALEIRDCPKLESFPKGGLPTPNLTSIFLSNCMNLKALPEQLHRLMSLQSLIINECPELMSFPERGLPTNLILLCITSCNKLTPQKNWQLQELACLSSFEIEGGCRAVVSFPEENLLPINLNSLRISNLLDLKFLNYKALQQLTCLETLEINCCNKLQSLPEEGLPSSLSSLCINECSLLRSRLQHKGKDWYKIAHIPHIVIN